jgi:hypothetical protein
MNELYDEGGHINPEALADAIDRAKDEIEEKKLEVKCECEENLTDDDSDSSPEAQYHGNYPQDIDTSLIN